MSRGLPKPRADGSVLAGVTGMDGDLASTLLSRSPSPMVLINSDTSIAYVNAAMERETGYTSEELIGRKAPYPWWTQDMLEPFVAGLRRVRPWNVSTDNTERLFRRRNGEKFWVQTSTSAVRLARRGKSYLAAWVDTTERRRMENRLRESEDTTRALLNASTHAAILVDLEGRILAANRAAAGDFNSTSERLVGANVFELTDAEVVGERRSKVVKAVRTGRPVHFEDEASGRIYENDIYPVCDTTGRVVHLAIFSRNVTGRAAIRDRVRATLKDLSAALPGLVYFARPFLMSRLTPREATVAMALSDAKSSREISRELGLSMKTIEAHRAHVMRKLGVRNAVELAALVMREGLA